MQRQNTTFIPAVTDYIDADTGMPVDLKLLTERRIKTCKAFLDGIYVDVLNGQPIVNYATRPNNLITVSREWYRDVYVVICQRTNSKYISISDEEFKKLVFTEKFLKMAAVRDQKIHNPNANKRKNPTGEPTQSNLNKKIKQNVAKTREKLSLPLACQYFVDWKIPAISDLSGLTYEEIEKLIKQTKDEAKLNTRENKNLSCIIEVSEKVGELFYSLRKHKSLAPLVHVKKGKEDTYQLTIEKIPEFVSYLSLSYNAKIDAEPAPAEVVITEHTPSISQNNNCFFNPVAAPLANCEASFEQRLKNINFPEKTLLMYVRDPNTNRIMNDPIRLSNGLCYDRQMLMDLYNKKQAAGKTRNGKIVYSRNSGAEISLEEIMNMPTDTKKRNDIEVFVKAQEVEALQSGRLKLERN
jgi:hypothetical protein